MRGAISVKEKYEELKMEIIEFEAEDIIVTSDGENTRPGDM